MTSNELLEYLKQRGVKDREYIDFIVNKRNEPIRFKLYTANGLDFMVSHMLNDCDQPGMGLIATNQMLRTENTEWMAIGLIEGDDVICLNIHTGGVYVWMIQTGEAEFLEVAKSFESFKDGCML